MSSPRPLTGRASSAYYAVRRNALLVLGIIVVLAALTGAFRLVTDRAREDERLRQAQVALAVLPTAMSDVVGASEVLLASQTFGRQSSVEVPILEVQLKGSVTQGIEYAAITAKRNWPTPMASRVEMNIGLLATAARELAHRTMLHQLAAAGAINDRRIQPLASTLLDELITAKAALARQIKVDDATTRAATAVVIGIAGLLLTVVAVGTVVTRRRRRTAETARLRNELAQENLRASERRMTALVEHGSDIVTVVQPDSSILYQAGAVNAIIGYEPQQLKGTRLTDVILREDRAALRALCALRAPGRGELRFVHRDSSIKICEVHATSLLDDPTWNGIVLNIWDLTTRKELEEQLRHQALHDTLTGLPNRALAIERAGQMLDRAHRNGGEVAALYIDLDGFKDVNDTQGHAAGDELLILVAERISSVIREHDLAARLGGDEFLVLMEASELGARPQLAASRLLAVIGQSYHLDRLGTDVSVSASIGIAVHEGRGADELLINADIALYRAKDGGRNRFVVFEELGSEATQHPSGCAPLTQEWDASRPHDAHRV